MKKVVCIIVLILTLAFIALARYDPNTFEIKNFQTSEEWAIGGDCNVIEGGSIDIESGGALKIGGTDITAALAGLDDYNEISFFNGGYVSNVDNNEIKIGDNGEAFAWDFDANTATIHNKTDITVYDLRAFPTTYLKLIDVCDITYDGTALTCTPAQLNYLTGTTLGTAHPSLVLAVGTANDLDYLKLTTLLIGSTALNQTEANAIDGITAGITKANSALIVNAANAVDVLAVTGIFDVCDITYDHVALTCTPTQLNYLTGTAIGVAHPSLVLTAGTANDLDYLKVTTLLVGSTSLNQAEANYIDGVTAGTTKANSALVVSAANAVDVLALTTIKIGDTTLNGAEANYIDGQTAGTAKPSTALIVGSANTVDYFGATTLLVGSTSLNQAEANAIDGVTAGVTKANSALIVSAANAVDVLTVTTIKVGDTTISGNEANFVDGAVAGTPAVYKAIVPSADLDIDRVNDVNGYNIIARNSIVIGANSLSEAEAGVLDGVAAGVASPSKAAVVGSANELDYLKVTTWMLSAGKITKATTAENQVILPDANGYFAINKIYPLSTGTIPASSCWGGTYISTSATDIDACLPAPTAGMDITFMLMAGTDVNITAAPNGNILYLTKRNTGPNSISSDEVAGSYIHLRAVDDANWFIMDVNGTWSGIN